MINWRPAFHNPQILPVVHGDLPKGNMDCGIAPGENSAMTFLRVTFRTNDSISHQL
jgi:hypothetical protein